MSLLAVSKISAYTLVASFYEICIGDFSYNRCLFHESLCLTELICFVFFRIRKYKENNFNSSWKDKTNTMHRKTVIFQHQNTNCKQNTGVVSTLSCILN